MSVHAQDFRDQPPKVATALTSFFYEGRRSSEFRSYDELAEAVGIARSTVWALVNGTRGASRGGAVEKIRAIAVALDLDPDKAVEKAGVRAHTDVAAVEKAIRALNWPREAQDDLISALREMDRTRRRR